MSIGIKNAVICLLLLGCSQQTSWQEPAQLSPTSGISEGAIKRSVRSLRRLAVVPVKYAYSRGDERIPKMEDRIERSLLSEALNLVGSKGYTVTPLYIYDDLILQKFNLSPREFKESLELLTEWARKSSDGQVPTAEVIDAVARISYPLNVDGLLVVQGFTTEPSRGTVFGSMVLAGPFFFFLPPLLIRTYTELHADIFEASTGRIVWRGGRRSSIDSLDSPHISLAELFVQLELADLNGSTGSQR
jgi:hypothetical protein